MEVRCQCGVLGVDRVCLFSLKMKGHFVRLDSRVVEIMGWMGDGCARGFLRRVVFNDRWKIDSSGVSR